jgi:sulfate transport system substrate-binding protein
VNPRRWLSETRGAFALGGLLLVYLAWPWFQEIRRATPPRRVLVVYGFSILGEAMQEGVFPAFKKRWFRETGEQVFFPSSFAGSGTITNQILLGAPAAVAILAHEGDALRLRDAGFTGTDWKEFPAKGVVNVTPFVIVTRAGNPKRIRSFADLTRSDVGVIHPDPLTSGGAAWAILAEFASALEDPASREPEAIRRGTERLEGVWRRVVGQSPSAMGSRAQFDTGFGDALVTYEQQGLLPGPHASQSEIVVPPVTVLSEHVAVLVDRNIAARDRWLAISFRDFLFSREAQEIFVKHGFRSAVDPSLDASNPKLAPLSRAIRVAEMGGWEEAYGLVVEEIWKGRILPELER